ncbi:unnamed protein product [Schistosoma margrebowiei]|uniref:Uncharacterized protein n=1 Tax=Schistosoma margrebowiei TaxID=48269 RepID=A0A183LJH5_9TREM|nr:unnamed protein product [Schistosoma margrebowiei]
MDRRRYNLAAGNKRLDSREMLSYSGHVEENALYTQRIALMLSEKARNALIGSKSHGIRITKFSFKTKEERVTINFTPCYVPTNDGNEDDKDQFCERLQSITAECSRPDNPDERPKHQSWNKQHRV